MCALDAISLLGCGCLRMCYQFRSNNSCITTGSNHTGYNILGEGEGGEGGGGIHKNAYMGVFLPAFLYGH